MLTMPVLSASVPTTSELVPLMPVVDVVTVRAAADVQRTHAVTIQADVHHIAGDHLRTVLDIQGSLAEISDRQEAGVVPCRAVDGHNPGRVGGIADHRLLGVDRAAVRNRKHAVARIADDQRRRRIHGVVRGQSAAVQVQFGRHTG